MKTLALLAALLVVAPLANGSSARRMLVTAYCLRGTTATGGSVGPGSIAVDPSVIPLGHRMWVDGYGNGRADDTGSMIRGYHIDVWMSSCAAALRWGVRYRMVRVR